MTTNNYPIYSIRDLDTPEPPTVWALDGMIKIPSVAMVVGKPESHKTNGLMDICASIVKGVPWVGIETRKYPVLWIDMDNSGGTTRMRLRAMRKHYGWTNEDPFYYMTLDPGTVDLSGSHRAQAILKLEGWVEQTGARVVVLDCFASISGDVDENTTAAGRVVAALRELSNKRDCAVIIVHHSTKGDNGGTYSTADKIRGSGAINGALDSAMLFDRKEHSNQVVVKCAKGKNGRFDDFAIYYNFTHIQGTKDLEEFWFSKEDLDNAKLRSRTAILERLKVGEQKSKELEDLCKPYTGRNTTLEILGELEKSGDVVSRGGNGKTKFYALANPEQLASKPNQSITRYNYEIQTSY
jgi:hypothetical protein